MAELVLVECDLKLCLESQFRNGNCAQVDALSEPTVNICQSKRARLRCGALIWVRTKMLQASETTASASTVSTSGSSMASFLTQLKSKPYTLSQTAAIQGLCQQSKRECSQPHTRVLALSYSQLIFSSLYWPSSIPHKYNVALSGNMRPSSFNHLSRATITVSSIDS